MTPADWVLAAGLAFSLGLSGWLWRRGRRLERRVDQRLPAVRLAPPASALQHVGLVRFRAFHDVGGDHSFALALLDGEGAGVVLNCLYHRDRCRVYAKPVEAWRSSYTLTDEEVEAIRQARGSAAE